MALQGADPRSWDLKQLCAAFEHQIRSNCKDDSEWQRERQKLYAPPRGSLGRRPGAGVGGGVRGPRGRPKAPQMAASDAMAMLKSMNAEDAMFNTG